MFLVPIVHLTRAKGHFLVQTTRFMSRILEQIKCSVFRTMYHHFCFFDPTPLQFHSSEIRVFCFINWPRYNSYSKFSIQNTKSYLIFYFVFLLVLQTLFFLMNAISTQTRTIMRGRNEISTSMQHKMKDETYSRAFHTTIQVFSLSTNHLFMKSGSSVILIYLPEAQ